jgi:integrase
LQKVQLPEVNLDRPNIKLGRSVYAGLKVNSKIPFTPYSLRHSWAIRTLSFDLPYAEAARQMGHSIAVHEAVYWKWLSPRHQQKINDMALNNPNRPQPPDFSFD